jgi:hypothetical protein
MEKNAQSVLLIQRIVSIFHKLFVSSEVKTLDKAKIAENVSWNVG